MRYFVDFKRVDLSESGILLGGHGWMLKKQVHFSDCGTAGWPTVGWAGDSPEGVLESRGSPETDVFQYLQPHGVCNFQGLFSILE